MLSPAIFIHAQGQMFHVMEANNVAFVMGENAAACRGLSPWRANELPASYKTINMGLVDHFHTAHHHFDHRRADPPSFGAVASTLVKNSMPAITMSSSLRLKTFKGWISRLPCGCRGVLSLKSGCSRSSR